MPTFPIVQSEKAEPFDVWLKRYYKSIGPLGTRDPRYLPGKDIEGLMKADDPYGYARADYMDPRYSADIALEALVRSTDIYRLLRKTTYQAEGDSVHYIKTDATGDNAFLGETGAMFAGDVDVPDVLDFDSLWPAVYYRGWKATEVGIQMAKIPGRSIGTSPEAIREYMRTWYTTMLDEQLAGVFLDPTGAAASGGHGVDKPATSTNATIESIDRMITNATESGATNHVDAVTDGDIYWNATNTGTAKIDRSGDTFANAQVKLPAAAGTEQAYNILDELDDLMAIAKKYAPTEQRNYIGICGEKALNKVQSELDPKSRITLDGDVEMTQTLNGVTTRPGVTGGKISIAALNITGIKVPFFTSPFLEGTATSTWLWKNKKYTTGGVGNIYLINMDNMELRHLIPITYQSWPDYAGNTLGYREMIFSAMQLICKRFACHAALKYIAS